ncbi:MAG: NADH-quinone oxidoreductase subunit J [Fibromonadaceae bacterium]|jgi:NADH-quinone oxidoreductase subunit J|nr:NADH-quinone oxidoreductase subunit J [Fibromonadaceae bacterium]
MFTTICFLLFAAICVVSALSLLVSKHPINGAMALVLNMISMAGIYTLINCTFLGVVQILVYAGAVMMLIVFVIMVLGGAKEARLPRMDKLGLCSILAVAAGGLLLFAAFQNADLQANATAINGSVNAVAEHLFDTSSYGKEFKGLGRGYFILFEITAFILLSAMVCAVMLSRKEKQLAGEK